METKQGQRTTTLGGGVCMNRRQLIKRDLTFTSGSGGGGGGDGGES